MAEEAGAEKDTVYSVKSIRWLGIYQKRPGKVESNLPALQKPSIERKSESLTGKSLQKSDQHSNLSSNLPVSSPELIGKIAGKAAEYPKTIPEAGLFECSSLFQTLARL